MPKAQRSFHAPRKPHTRPCIAHTPNSTDSIPRFRADTQQTACISLSGLKEYENQPNPKARARKALKEEMGQMKPFKIE